MLMMLMLLVVLIVKMNSGDSDACFSCGIDGVGTCWYWVMSIVLMRLNILI